MKCSQRPKELIFSPQPQPIYRIKLCPLEAEGKSETLL